MSYYPYVEHILERASVKRAQEAMDRLKVSGHIHALSESARTAQEAADSLGVEVVWAAAGHPHAVYPTSYAELLACTAATPMMVGE